jgi:hypothetical protein
MLEETSLILHGLPHTPKDADRALEIHNLIVQLLAKCHLRCEQDEQAKDIVDLFAVLRNQLLVLLVHLCQRTQEVALALRMS